MQNFILYVFIHFIKSILFFSKNSFNECLSRYLSKLQSPIIFILSSLIFINDSTFVSAPISHALLFLLNILFNSNLQNFIVALIYPITSYIPLLFLYIPKLKISIICSPYIWPVHICLYLQYTHLYSICFFPL